MTRKEEQKEEEEEEEGGLNYFPRLFLARSKRCLLIVGEERRRIVGSLPLLCYLTYDRGVRCCSNQESLFYRRGEKEEGTSWKIRMPRTVQ